MTQMSKKYIGVPFIEFILRCKNSQRYLNYHKKQETINNINKNKLIVKNTMYFIESLYLAIANEEFLKIISLFFFNLNILAFMLSTIKHQLSNKLYNSFEMINTDVIQIIFIIIVLSTITT